MNASRVAAAPALAWILLACGCSMLGNVGAVGRPVMEAYAGAPGLRVLNDASPLRAEKQVPVLRTPEVFAAYVPAHTRGDLLIGDHWIFFKLREAGWFIEDLQDPDPPFDGVATPEQLRPLRGLDASEAVVPHVRTP